MITDMITARLISTDAFEGYPTVPGDVFSDIAYRGNHWRRGTCQGWNVTYRRQRYVGTGRSRSLARLEAFNQPIHRIRGRIEKIFGTWKRSYGLRRMRWRGLAKAVVQIRLTAIAYNMKRSWRSSLWLDSG